MNEANERYNSLLPEWSKKNKKELREYSAGSHHIAWWQCRNGHEWQARIYDRYRGAGCPYCAGKRPFVGETDLKTINPELAAEWHPTLNGSLRPEDVTSGSQKRVWWKCQYGHEWQASVKSRNAGNGCPYCSGRLPIVGETDLKTINPKLAEEWHTVLNGDLRPEDVTAGSQKSVWWKCQYGHEWRATVARRSAGKGCPVCNHMLPGKHDHNLAVDFPDVAAMWDYDKNENMPSDYLPHSNKYAWFICIKGHSWYATINSMTRLDRGTGCPYCAGKRVLPGETDLASRYPDIAKEWDFQSNKLLPSEVSPASGEYAWWLCPNGHRYHMRIANRIYNARRCPICHQ